MKFFFILFVGVPLVEMLLLIKIGGHIGTLPTIALVCATAFVGVYLIREQGGSAMKQAQAKIQQGYFPTKEIIDGVCLLIAGALLLTPGLVTDTLGFLLLMPFLRHSVFTYFVNKGLMRKFASQRPDFNERNVHSEGFQARSDRSNYSVNDAKVIDVEYTHIHDEDYD